MHAKSLRAIGQSLEMLRVQAFSLEKEGDSYIVRSESLTPTRQWILRNSLAENNLDSPGPHQQGMQLTWGDGWLCYGALEVARLDAQGLKKRQDHGLELRGADKLDQLLRALGEHLDRKEATVFQISWTPDSISVDYQMPDGVSERKDFTVEKLHKLALHSRFRRRSRSGLLPPAERSRY
jgi:hypothetical protein